MTKRFARRQRGVTMLEVLIAILIISIGVLGTAALQANSLKANVGASQRSAATLLAYDMADRVRANTLGAVGNHYIANIATQTAACIDGAGCTEQQMAQHDIWDWRQALSVALPGAQGYICKDASPDDGSGNASAVSAACDGQGDIYVVKIWWFEDRSSSNPTGALKRVVVSFQP